MDLLISLDEQTIQNIEERFFTSHRTHDASEDKIIDFIKAKNNKIHFVEKAVRQIGYPRWNKTMLFKKPSSKILSRGTDADSVSIYFIPFVRDSQNFVNATMIVEAEPGDTSFYYVCDWQYKSLEHSSQAAIHSAERYALFFMTQDNRVFGYTKFNITDTGLFAGATPDALGKKQLNIINISTPTNIFFVYHEICVDTYVCGSADWCTAHGGCDYSNCASGDGEPDHCYVISSVCSQWWEETGGGGETGGGTSTGGNGETGGGGSTAPNPCNGTPNNPADPYTAQSNVVDPGDCPPPDTGWEPLPEENDPPIIDTTYLNQIARGISRQSDSVFNWAMQPTNNYREQAGIIVRKNGEIYLKNLRPGNAGGTRSIDYSTNIGEELLGYFHTHPVDPDYKLRSFFSDDDFWEFHKYARTNQGYLMALECGNKLFIAVVEDVQKYQTFMTIARVIQLKKEGYIETVLTPQQPNYYTHGQQASINAAIQFFGSAANCGLGFYETTYPEKTNFIKINP